MTSEIDLAASILHGTVNAGTPIAFAAIGEVVAEKSGVQNLGVEGMMQIGAFAGFAGALATGSPVLGLLAGTAAGCLLALVHAIFAVDLRVSQISSGLALAFLGTGLASFLGRSSVGQVCPQFSPLAVPGLSRIPCVGYGLFQHPWPAYAALLLAPLVALFLRQTRPGLSLEVVGEAPEAAESLGIPVQRVRRAATLFGGGLAGAGGAYLSLAVVPSWVDNMTTGRGWIALAMVVFGGYTALGGASGAYLLGGMDAVGLRLQAFGVDVPPSFLAMAPYLVAILLVTLYSAGRFRRRFGAPRALGKPYDPSDPRSG